MENVYVKNEANGSIARIGGASLMEPTEENPHPWVVITEKEYLSLSEAIDEASEFGDSNELAKTTEEAMRKRKEDKFNSFVSAGLSEYVARELSGYAAKELSGLKKSVN